MLFLVVSSDSGFQALARRLFATGSRKHSGYRGASAPKGLGSLDNPPPPLKLRASGQEGRFALEATAASSLELWGESETTSAIEPVVAATIVAGCVGLVMYGLGIANRAVSNKALRKHEKGSKDEVEQEKNETCSLLKQMYDRLRFQHHGMCVLLESLSGMGPDKWKDTGEYTGPWKSWIDLLASTEAQMLLLFNTFGGSELCDERAEMPGFKMIQMTGRAHSDRLAEGDVKATGLLIVGGSEPPRAQGEDAEQWSRRALQQEGKSKLLSRLLAYLNVQHSEPMRSGYLQVESMGKWVKRWFIMESDTSGLRLWAVNSDGDDDNSSYPHYNLEDLESVVLQPESKGKHGRKHCMTLYVLGGALHNKFCAPTKSRIQQWIRSLVYHACKFELEKESDVNTTMSERKRMMCHSHMGKIQEAAAKKKFQEMPNKAKMPEAWMALPWRQRALDANIRLLCQDGAWSITAAEAITQRKADVLEWGPRSLFGSVNKVFVLLKPGRLSWYSSISETKQQGEILVHNLMVDYTVLQAAASASDLNASSNCFAVMGLAGGDLSYYRVCALGASAANSWIDALHAAYANQLGLPLDKDGRASKGSALKEGKLLGMVFPGGSTPTRAWSWVQLKLFKDRLEVKHAGDGAGITDQTWLLSWLDPLSVSFMKPDELRDIIQPMPHSSSPLLAQRENDSDGGYLIPTYGMCLSFVTRKLTARPQFATPLPRRHFFCGLMNMDKDGKDWGAVLRDALLPFTAERGEKDASPRDEDPKWGQLLLHNPLEHPQAVPLLNQLLAAFPDALLSGLAPLCPSRCSCPLYSRPFLLEDILDAPQGHIRFELRSCGGSGAEIYSVKYHQCLRDEPVLELRLRGFVREKEVASANTAKAAKAADASAGEDERELDGNSARIDTEAPPGELEPNSPSASEENCSLENYECFTAKRIEAPHACNVVALTELLQLLWRFTFARDGVTLSEKMPQLRPRPEQLLAPLVLHPLVAQYRTETLRRMRQFDFEGFRDVSLNRMLASCSDSQVWQTLQQLEQDELLLVDLFGGAAGETDAERNRNSHRHRMDQHSAVLLASEFWRSINEHGCGEGDLWHPLERACYVFCQKKGRCSAERQVHPGTSVCITGVPSIPSDGACQQVCRVLLPGHPGCELGDPSGLPAEVENFYKATTVTSFQVGKFFVWDTPRTMAPAYALFVGYPYWLLTQLHGNVLGAGLDGILGITSATGEIAHGLTTGLSICMGYLSVVMSLASIAWEIWSITDTWKKFGETKNYFTRVYEEKVKKVQYLRCKVLGSIEYAREESKMRDKAGRSQQEALVTQLKESPEVLQRLQRKGAVARMVSRLCDGPLIAEFPKKLCREAIQPLQDAVGHASEGGAQSSPELILQTLGGLFEETQDSVSKPLSNETAWCREEFPLDHGGGQSEPITSLHVSWFQGSSRDTEGTWQQWVRQLQHNSNINYEPLYVADAEEVDREADAKMGMGGALQALLLAVRKPGARPLTELEVYHLPRQKPWSPRSGETPPSKTEYDLGILIAMAGKTPAGLAAGATCELPNDSLGERCTLFSKRFKGGAEFVDTLRAGGFVDLNMACGSNRLAGREESLWSSQELEVLLGASADENLPPIVEAQLSDKAWDPELGAKGFFRAELGLNFQCSGAFYRRASYLYYRREWTVRRNFKETMLRANQLESEVEACLQPTYLRMRLQFLTLDNERRCKLCRMCEPTEKAGCRTIGRLDVWEYTGADKAGNLQRVRRVFIGELYIQYDSGSKRSKNERPHYTCKAAGAGRLWAVTQTLAATARTSGALAPETFSEGDFPPARKVTHWPNEEAPRWKDEEVQLPNGSRIWTDTPRESDFFYVGSVQSFGDAGIFERRREVPARSAHDLMCDSWVGLEKRLQRAESAESDLRVALLRIRLLALQKATAEGCSSVIEHCTIHGEVQLSEVLAAVKRTPCEQFVEGFELAKNFDTKFNNEVIFAGSFFEKKEKLAYVWWANRAVNVTRHSLSVTSERTSEGKSTWDLEAISVEKHFPERPNSHCMRVVGSSEGAQHQTAVLCVDRKEAARAEHFRLKVYEAKISMKTGMAPTAAGIVRTALWMHCGSKQWAPEDLLAPRPAQNAMMPEGFGDVYKLETGVHGDAQLRWYERAQGRFSRGDLVGVGQTWMSDGSKQVGRFSHGALHFGTLVLQRSKFTKLSHAASLFTKAFNYSSLSYTGYLLDSSEPVRGTYELELSVPAHLGALRDPKGRPLYWGQFSLAFPWGLGVWVDHHKKTVFRGVIKKEYESFTSGAEEASFVPLLAGELTRMEGDRPITDDEVLNLTADQLPDELLSVRSMYFDQAAGSENLKLVCRSKAIFEWKKFLLDNSRIIDVWQAVSEHSPFAYDGRLRVTATEEDVLVLGDRVRRVLQVHADQLVGLRRHLKNLNQSSVFDVEQRINGSVRVLGEAAARGQAFDAWDPYWKEALRHQPELLQVAARLQKLGAASYIRFSSAQSFVEAIDDVLDSATTSYCMQCLEGNAPKRAGHFFNFPELSISISDARNLPVDDGDIRVEVSVGRLNRTTSFRRASFGRARWTNHEPFKFSGSEQRLEASTWIEVTLSHRSSYFPQRQKSIARWRQRLLSIIGRKGEGEWLKLTSRASASGDGDDEDAAPELRVAFSTSSMSSALTGAANVQQVLPDGCGVAYAVERLIRNNNNRLRRVEAQMTLVGRSANEIVDSVTEKLYSNALSAEPALEQFVPDITANPPAPRIDGTLHQDVFQGIRADDGPSVGLLKEKNSLEDFFVGPRMFDNYIARSNPAAFRLASNSRWTGFSTLSPLP